MAVSTTANSAGPDLDPSGGTAGRLAPSPSRPEAQAVTVIRPARRWQLIDVGELWRFRELIGFLAWRDVKVRYKQTLLGAAWAVLQPALLMVVFTLFLSRVGGRTGDVPYPLFAYAGLLPWTFFATAITNAGNSVVGSERLITKIYFPRLAIPFSGAAAAVVDFVFAFGLLVVLMIYYGVAPGISLVFLPIVLIPIGLTALGVGTLLAALNVYYRDFRYVIPFLVQLWMFATPTVYMAIDEPSASAPASAPARDGAPPSPSGRTAGPGPGVLRAALQLNPLTGLISAFRSAVLGRPMPWRALGISWACAVLSFLVGCLYFRQVEDGFADVI